MKTGEVLVHRGGIRAKMIAREESMRTSMGLRVFFGISTAAVLTSAFIACGGSDDNQDVISGDAGPETSLPDTSVPDTTPAGS